MKKIFNVDRRDDRITLTSLWARIKTYSTMKEMNSLMDPTLKSIMSIGYLEASSIHWWLGDEPKLLQHVGVHCEMILVHPTKLLMRTLEINTSIIVLAKIGKVSKLKNKNKK